MDYRIIERMTGVPFEFRMRAVEIELLLKPIFKDIASKEIIRRVKIGFLVSLSFLNLNGNSGKTPMDN